MVDSTGTSLRETMILVGNGDQNSVEEYEVSIPAEETNCNLEEEEEAKEIREELNEKIQKYVESQEELAEKEKSKEELELEEALATLKKLTVIFIIPFVASLIGRKLSVHIWRWFKRY
ncbi:hypothetical protein HANVADRAFT_53785, partial [Hanseniaspora valbyensis NRRL Y-1626]